MLIVSANPGLFWFSQFVIQNPFVSNKHLRIYTILFDQENPQEVPPLVYAQDLSMNGTLWNEYPMGKANGSFLLSDGDVLRVTAGVYIRFRSAGYSEENRMSYLQRIEMRVSIYRMCLECAFLVIRN